MGLLLSPKSLAVCRKCSTFAAVSLTGIEGTFREEGALSPSLRAVPRTEDVSETTSWKQLGDIPFLYQ